MVKSPWPSLCARRLSFARPVIGYFHRATIDNAT
jgi:hypothetical protein